MARLFRVGVLVLTAAAGLVVHAQPQQITFFVAAATVTGEPVTDLTAEDFAVAEDGRQATNVRIVPVKWPIKLTVLVDNGFETSRFLSLYRSGLKALFAALPAGVEASLLTLSPQPRWVVRPTSDAALLSGGTDRITPDESASRMIEGLVEAAARIDEESRKQVAYFPVIVVLSTTGPEGSTSLNRDIDRMASRLTMYPARVHVIMLGTGVTSPSQIVGARQVQVAKIMADRTGGRYEAIAAASRIPALLAEYGAMIAEAHAFQSRQYRVTADRPAGLTGAVGQILAGSTRPGVRFTATAQGLKP
jgi:hypothetical protein